MSIMEVRKMETIEDKLRKLIISRYGTMIDFSRAVNISNSTLASILSRGIHNASVNNIIKICKALGISADGLASNQIIPIEDETTDKWNFKDINEITTFVKITVTSAKHLTINGNPLTDNEIQTFIDSLDLTSELIKKKVERRKELQ